MTAPQLPLHAVERFNPQTFSQEEMERLLSAIRAREITAAVVSNSHAAEWLLELCQTGGIRIPEELSVVCFDQPRIFQGMEPLFTYVEQNSFEMGRRAAELLRKRKSRRAILDDLHAKGIDRGAAAEAVEALFAQSEEDEEENPELANARALVERHYAAKLAQGKWQQVAAALARRGFSHSVIRQALADAETEETEA